MGLSKYIGIPHSKLNCWQLCVKFYWEELGVELKHYFDGAAPEDKKEIKNLISTNVGDFKKTDTPKYGDLILLKVEGVESHIGIYIDSERLLHSKKKIGSVLDRLDFWKHRIVGFYTV